MNYLAHLTLSYFDAELQVGNFLGDMVRGVHMADLPPGIRRGVEMHRAIDALTDADPQVRSVNQLLALRHGRYATVLSDIAFDYYLYRHWERFGPLPFPDFTQETYRRLRDARPLMPPAAARRTTGMTDGRWLLTYTSRRGLLDVYRRLLPRLSRPELLVGIERSLDEYGPALNRTLRLLFPRLLTLANHYRASEPHSPPTD